MRIDQSDIDRVDMERLRPFVEGEERYFKLLAYLSTQVSGTIFDIGTWRGNSARALSYGGNPVESFDIADHVHGRAAPPNVHYHLENLYTTEGANRGGSDCSRVRSSSSTQTRTRARGS